MDLLKIKDDTTIEKASKSFREIAETLFNEYALKTHNGDLFRLTEIEFYWYSPTHEDFSVYPRTTKVGEWFFHFTGVDIALKNEKGFGGILIRGIKNEKEKIKGPQNSAMRIFSGVNAFSSNNNFAQIVHHKYEKANIIQSKRVRVTCKKNIEEGNNFNDAPYAFKHNS